MKQGVKEKVIRTTAQLITRHGIRNVRVDEIAQRLGISKRTLYELFHDKTELINCCLEDIKCRQRSRIAAHLNKQSGHPLQSTFWLMNEFLEALYSVDRGFLAELRHKADYAEKYQESKQFWEGHFGRLLQEGQQTEYFLEDTDMGNFSSRLLIALQESRLDGLARHEQEEFCRIVLRGLSTRKGIEWIDDQHARQHQPHERPPGNPSSGRNQPDVSH